MLNIGHWQESPLKMHVVEKRSLRWHLGAQWLCTPGSSCLRTVHILWAFFQGWGNSLNNLASLCWAFQRSSSRAEANEVSWLLLDQSRPPEIQLGSAPEQKEEGVQKAKLPPPYLAVFPQSTRKSCCLNIIRWGNEKEFRADSSVTTVCGKFCFVKIDTIIIPYVCIEPPWFTKHFHIHYLSRTLWSKSGRIVILILQIRKLRIWRTKQFTQGHRWQEPCQAWKPPCLVSILQQVNWLCR